MGAMRPDEPTATQRLGCVGSSHTPLDLAVLDRSPRKRVDNSLLIHRNLAGTSQPHEPEWVQMTNTS